MNINNFNSAVSSEYAKKKASKGIGAMGTAKIRSPRRIADSYLKDIESKGTPSEREIASFVRKSVKEIDKTENERVSRYQKYALEVLSGGVQGLLVPIVADIALKGMDILTEGNEFFEKKDTDIGNAAMKTITQNTDDKSIEAIAGLSGKIYEEESTLNGSIHHETKNITFEFEYNALGEIKKGVRDKPDVAVAKVGKKVMDKYFFAMEYLEQNTADIVMDSITKNTTDVATKKLIETAKAVAEEENKLEGNDLIKEIRFKNSLFSKTAAISMVAGGLPSSVISILTTYGSAVKDGTIRGESVVNKALESTKGLLGGLSENYDSSSQKGKDLDVKVDVSEDFVQIGDVKLKRNKANNLE